MKQYTLGFCFLQDHSCLLITKERPKWQAGRVNGLGGSIEVGETPKQAMVREFEEESGISTHEKQWLYMLTYGCVEWEVNVFKATLTYIPEITYGDEGVVSLYHELPPNMEETAKWLYWMCRDSTTMSSLSVMEYRV